MIVGARIDFRLIHGQVANLWANARQVSRFMVVDDQVAEDATQKQVLRMATAGGARTTPYGESLGTIEPGKGADLSLVDWDSVSYPYMDEETPLLDAVVITQSSSPRAIPADVLADLARDVFEDDDRVLESSSLPDAIQRAVDLAEAGGDQFGGVVAAGSITLAAEVRDLLGLAEEV